jgi:Uncharacterized protein conserved in bacteria
MNTIQNLDISALNVESKVVEADIDVILEKELASFDKKIIVLDDDPTGTQTVHNVFVYTNWEEATLLEAFRAKEPLFYVLTNSRSFSEEHTVKVHAEIAKNIQKVGEMTGTEFLIISRGDSTLRGHYPLETKVLKQTLEKQGTIRYDGEIICPFFIEGGRFTLQDIHYVQEGATLIPAGRTDFAKDKTFGYESSDLGQYIEEKSNGEYTKESCVSISLEELRGGEVDVITKKLLQVTDFRKVIVNAVSYIDLKVFTVAWLRVMNEGKNFLVRSAAGVPKIIGGITERPLLKKEEVTRLHQQTGGLIVIGSHVKKTTLQFQALQTIKSDLTFIEFDVEAYKKDGSFDLEVTKILEQVNKLLQNGQSVVIYTSRKLSQIETTDKEEILALSVKISEALTGIVRKLSVEPRFLIAKGGITSSDIATKGLTIRCALVLGQIKPGIPVWKTQEESTFVQMPYIIFPGNVGNIDTLKEIVEELSE